MKRLLLLLSFAFLANPLFAQEFRSTLTGRVLDPSGAPVPNVRLIITNTATGAQSEVTSGKDGYYTAPSLTPGRTRLRQPCMDSRSTCIPESTFRPPSPLRKTCN